MAGKQVTIEYDKRDRYGRIVGKVLHDGIDLCLEQIKAGFAWHYKKYQHEQSLEDQRLYADAENANLRQEADVAVAFAHEIFINFSDFSGEFIFKYCRA